MTGYSSYEIKFRYHRQGKPESFDVNLSLKSSRIVRNVKAIGPFRHYKLYHIQ